MTGLLETIRIEDRQIKNAEFHNRRMNRARADLFGLPSDVDVSRIIKIPIGMGMGVFKCRILYDRVIREVQVIPYTPKPVKSLKIVEDNEIDYKYKYADRSRLEGLLSLKGDCHEILIVKDGCITDTSYSNIIFQAEDGNWVTPDTPLLKGTMRQFLLEKREITEERIIPADLSRFTLARMINCMMDIESGHLIGIDDIIS
jgi:4-amino-4-deoxychorismate lyase